MDSHVCTNDCFVFGGMAASEKENLMIWDWIHYYEEHECPIVMGANANYVYVRASL